MGKPLYPVISGFFELGVRSYAAIYLSAKIGYHGIFYASPLAWVAGATVVFIGYYINIYRRSEEEIKAEYHALYQRLEK